MFDGGRPAGRSGDGQRQVPERVKGDAAVAAHGALQRRLELADKQVDNVRVVATQVPTPSFGRFIQVTWPIKKKQKKTKKTKKIN